MDLISIIESTVTFCRQHPIAAAVAACALLYFAWRSSKLFLGLLSLAIILAALLYFIMDLGAVGRTQKQKLYEQTDRHIRQDR